ncbi:alpha/beta fold hydrolase [Kutzneria kofuensis]|uniref:Pimeloyl-ACP methyl ester carboxylesterase n=1 Tax=Kutzneria kofuensis TaxID=103725 RepID=A0A7W9KRH9_9PSEU|nr:alpha/beta hydrolase [Kutzneria kofuensis]MBB5897282.1 pimeloyl-ACP methyl ester carboxylesterase [Kutzneria kofuensis]
MFTYKNFAVRILDGMTSSLARWGGTSRYADIGGQVHYVDFGGPADGPPMVLVHGLGGSHLDWSLLAPRLATRFRITAPDLLGYGLTTPDHRVSTVDANTDLIDRFIHQVTDKPVVLVGNSMGGLIAARQAAKHPETVSKLVLIDPALPLVPRSRPDVAATMILGRLALPLLGRTILALGRRGRTARQQVRETFARCCVDPSRVPENLVAALVELIEHRAGLPGADEAFLASARTLLAINGGRRTAWAALNDIAAPVLLVHGEQDRLVSVGSAREAARRLPQWTVDVLPGLGHLPQIEAPDRVASRMLSWLG